MNHQSIRTLNIKYKDTIWKNKKNNMNYKIIIIAYDAINHRGYNQVVVYSAFSNESLVFVRELKEFQKKFTQESQMNDWNTRMRNRQVIHLTNKIVVSCLLLMFFGLLGLIFFMLK